MPAYLETEQELSRLARRAAGMRGGPRLLILPGVMGSSIGRLRKNGGADVTWFDPVEIAQGQLVKLALPGGNRYWAVGVLKFAYERLRLVLRIAGFDAVFHPYDWRRDMLWNGRELADRLLREKRQDVVIVGHSMGGLVARAALAHKGGERIARVIQLGAPNKGTFVSVQALRGTYPLIRRVAMLDLKHSADELAREMLVTFPGLCDLLPAASLCKDFDPFDPGQWPEGPRPEAELLERSRAAIATLPPPDDRFRLIAGFGQDTVLGLRRSGRKLDFGRGPAGDGTVPLALAQWPGLKTWYAEESHGSLPGNADVGRAVADLARNGTTNALPQVLPRRRGVPTLWQEDVRAAPEPKIAWSDLSEREQREFLHEFVGVTLPSTAAAAPKRDAAAKPVELSFMEGSITQSNAGRDRARRLCERGAGRRRPGHRPDAARRDQRPRAPARDQRRRRRGVRAAGRAQRPRAASRRVRGPRALRALQPRRAAPRGGQRHAHARARGHRELRHGAVGHDLRHRPRGRGPRPARGRADGACRPRARSAPQAHHDRLARRQPDRRGAARRRGPAAPASGGAAPQDRARAQARPQGRRVRRRRPRRRWPGSSCRKRPRRCAPPCSGRRPRPPRSWRAAGSITACSSASIPASCPA